MNIKKLAATMLLGLGAANLAAAADITVTSFGGVLKTVEDKAYFSPFKKATGINVIAADYDGGLAKVQAMVDTKSVSWDVVEMESPDLARGCATGLFEKLDYSKIGSKADFVPGAAQPCGVAVFVWSTGLAYNADKLKVAPTSWADFFDLKKFPGKRGIRKGPKYNLEIALMADGVEPKDVYKVLSTQAGVDRAFKMLDKIKPAIQAWEAGAQPAQYLAAGDVVLSVAYNGRIAAAQQEGKNLKMVWNGSIYDFDYWAIPKGAKNLDEAYKFIAFATRPENQKQFSQLMPYAPSNSKALPMIDAKLVAELPTAPANIKNAVAIDTDFWSNYGEALEQRFNTWAAK